MTSIIVPGQDVADSIQAQRTLLRLESVTPSPAAPLTDEDLAIFQSKMDRGFEYFAKASYLEYAFFFSAAMGKLISECREKL